MRIDILTLFPAMLGGFLTESIIGRALEAKLAEINVRNLRDWSTGKHKEADDRPFGGGAGMVLKPEPIFAAMEELATPGCRRIFLTPDGAPLTQKLVVELAQVPHLILLSGHYEGVDQRARDSVIDQEISIGDYVLTNGTIAAAVLVDAIVRNIPGVLGDENSLTHESFNNNLLDFPQFTRPAEFRGMVVPDVLLSGNHAAIERWRHEMRLAKTTQVRPDLLRNKS